MPARTMQITPTLRAPKSSYDETMQSSRGAVTASLTLLLFRGVLLWLVVPVATCVWVMLAVLRRRPAGLGQFLGWVDLNLIAALNERRCVRFSPLAPNGLRGLRLAT